MNEHCQEYENLTMEEKLLVDAKVREWFAQKDWNELYTPTFIFKIAEQIVIERLKEENDKRNRKPGSSRTNSEQGDTRNCI